MDIWAHCLVKNEAKWLWYSVASIINHVDKVLLWDTGSTDGSIEIEKEIRKRWPEKVEYKLRPQVTAEDFTKVRQEMLEETTSDWLIIVDADEIWWEESIKKVITSIKSNISMEAIVVPTINPVGDIYHRQEEKAGKYRVAGRSGHYNLRAFRRNIPGLHVTGPHGQMGYVDIDGKPIQDRGEEKVVFIDAPYLHTTFLERAGQGKDYEVIKRAKKRRYEIGDPFAFDFYYPEVLFRPRPEIVESSWRVMDGKFKIRAFAETPLRKLKRRIWKGRVGY